MAPRAREIRAIDDATDVTPCGATVVGSRLARDDLWVVSGYGGTYRASVVDNLDPMQQHRLHVIVPDVYGDISIWAEPSLPAGSGGALRAIGDMVWVCFEHGDSDYPVWQPDQVADQSPYPSAGYVGVYRGIVVGNEDPMQQHRLEVSVPDVDPSPMWATPSVDVDDSQLPDVGSDVWIEFENGDPLYPGWVGLA